MHDVIPILCAANHPPGGISCVFNLIPIQNRSILLYSDHAEYNDYGHYRCSHSSIYRSGKQHSPFGSPFTLDEFMSEQKHCGFDRVCGSVLIRHQCTVRQANRTALKIRERYPDFYIPGLQVHDSDPEGSCRELEIRYHEHQVRWIGELVQHSTGTGEYNSPGMFRIFRSALPQ